MINKPTTEELKGISGNFESKDDFWYQLQMQFFEIGSNVLRSDL